MHPPKIFNSFRQKEGKRKRFPDSVPCSNSPTLAVGSSTAVLCSGDQGRVAGVQYCVDSLLPAIPKEVWAEPGTMWHPEVAVTFLHGPAARQMEVFCPFHPLTVFHFHLFSGENGCSAHAANNLQILTGLFTLLLNVH